MVTWFYLGNVFTHKVNPKDFSAIYLFIDNISFQDHLIVRLMFEFSLTTSFATASLFVVNLVSDYFKGIIHKYLHVCDTHHGINPISSAVQFASELNPDSLSCNQAHHLHFFRTNSFINLPRVSVDNIYAYETLKFRQKSDALSSTIYFPAVRNNIHIKRFSFYSQLSSNLPYGVSLSNQRFNHYPDWLSHVSNARAFVYVPLGTSIGLNNIIPAAITNTKILAYKLSPFTSQQKMYSFLGSRVSYFSSLHELYQLVQDSNLLSPSDVNTSIYREILPTPKRFLKSIVLRNDELFTTLHPAKLDSRYEELRILASKLSEVQFFEMISFYESLQYLYERLDSISLAIPTLSNMRINDYIYRYLSLLVEDITTLRFLDLQQIQDCRPADPHLVFCIMQSHLEILPEFLSTIPCGSFVFSIGSSAPINKILRASNYLECPFEDISFPFIYYKK